MGAGDTSIYKGVSAINISMLTFVVGDTMMKLLGRSLPSMELVFLRSAIIFVSLGIILIIRRKPLHLPAYWSAPLLGRCLFDCINIICFATAVIHIKIAEIYAIFLMSPVLMTVIAAIFLREPVGWRRWSAVGVGFCGVLMVVKPDVYALDQWALVAFLSALAGAIRETITQKIDSKTTSIEVAFCSALVAGVVPFVFRGNEAWLAPIGIQHAMVLVQAFTWLAGLLIQACRFTPLSIVASFRYTMLIWGTLSGYLVFGDVPDAWSVAGSVLIIACGLYVFHREAVRHRQVASNVVPLS